MTLPAWHLTRGDGLSGIRHLPLSGGRASRLLTIGVKWDPIATSHRPEISQKLGVLSAQPQTLGVTEGLSPETVWDTQPMGENKIEPPSDKV